MPCPKIERDRFDVLAETQAIDSEIDAVADRMLCLEVPDFDPVRQAARRFDAEIGEDGMSRVGVRDGERFLAAALTAFVDFVRIGGAPVVS